MTTSEASMSLGSTLAAFRRQHTPRSQVVDGVAFPYFALGSAAAASFPAVVILPGLLGVGEMSFQLAEALAVRHRVLVPSWPRDADRADLLVRGIASILDAEGLSRAALVGASFGGLLAQRFVVRYPDRVSHLVLADTSVPRRQRASANRRAARLFAVLPGFCTRFLLRSLSARAMRDDDPRGFWAQYTAEVVATLSSADLASRYRVAADLDAGPALAGGAFTSRTLLLESDDDPLVNVAAARALQEAFCGAARHVFHQGGHSPAIRYPTQYAQVLTDFLTRDERAAAMQPNPPAHAMRPR